MSKLQDALRDAGLKCDCGGDIALCWYCVNRMLGSYEQITAYVKKLEKERGYERKKRKASAKRKRYERREQSEAETPDTE